MSRPTLYAAHGSITPAARPVPTSGGGSEFGRGADVTDLLVKESWSRVLADLQQHVGDDHFNLWLRHTLVVRMEPELVEVGVPNLAAGEWIERRFGEDILKSVERVAGFRPRGLRFTVNGHLFRELRKQEQLARQPQTAIVEARRAAPPQTSRQIFNLNERYTLDRVIVGPSNQLAYNCCFEVARRPGEAFNPLYLYGRSGTGKSHLLQGVAREIHERHPRMEVLYVPAEYFVNQFTGQLRSKNLEPFRRRFRDLDVLLIDDLQFFANKDATQEELLHTLDALVQAGKQVVLASDAAPRALQGFMEQLTTRFTQGMVAEVELPPFQTRMAIIKSKLEGHRHLFPDEVVTFLAQKLECNVREIEGYVTRLVAPAGLCGQKVTLQLAQQALSDFLQHRSRMVELTDIENLVIAHYGVSSAALHSRLRKRPVALARQVCMYLARTLTSYSLKEIGRFFGNKNHTTVVFAHQTIDAKIARSKSLAAEVENLRRQLLGPQNGKA
ncbi:chromosomal replication initiator protein DnaA [bacterium]|nr:MAG: chromosomal replication initiator protein DnaA [bacterium]RIK63375.1 MAG: chromosomal replication initiator protein DnaA [Planctomycetota bacterium]